MKIRMNREWALLLEKYKGDHRDPRNQATHMIGIPMILASLPMMASIVALPPGLALFTVGWGFQFLGHYFEGNDPAFLSDRRSLIIGALWWAQKAGVIELDVDLGAPPPARPAAVAQA
jgi:uncharacterized membrane protein YGL010W